MKKYTIAFGILLSLGLTTCYASNHAQMTQLRDSHPILKNSPIKIVSPFSPELTWMEGVVLAGSYNEKSQRIFIPNNLFWTDTKWAMLHETGHWVWNTKMSEAQRWNYSKLFQKEGKMVSWYARTDLEENFCEMFAYAGGNRQSIYSGLEEYLNGSAQYRYVQDIIKDIIAN